MELVRNEQGSRTTPSVVALSGSGDLLVGAPAQRQAIMNPALTISEVKRLVGLRHNSDQVRQAQNILQYEIIAAPNGDAWVQLDKLQMSPQEVQSHTLECLAAAASKFHGKAIKRAVITVPAFFDETQRKSVRDAAEIAGLAVERLITEPTAAAISYGYGELDRKTIVVVDLGGGTLDVTVMAVSDANFKVLATCGDNILGGADFDRVIAQHLAEQFLEQAKTDVRQDPVAMQRLLIEAETAKKALSQTDSATISLPYLAEKDGQPLNFDFTMTRELFSTLAGDLVERIVGPCRDAVASAGIEAGAIDDVILVGGMTRSPIISDKVGELFQRRPSIRINPDEAIAMGAALVAASLSGHIDGMRLIDVAPRSIGIRGAGGTFVPLIKQSTPLPATARKVFRTTENNQPSFELFILQGESEKAADNRRLCHVVVEPIPLKPAGEVMLEVVFFLDHAGTLRVEAKERGSKDLISVAVEAYSGLTSSQVERLATKRRLARGDTEGAPTPMAPSEVMGGFSIDFGEPTVPATPAALASVSSLSEADLFGDAAKAEEPKAASVEPTPKKTQRVATADPAPRPQTVVPDRGGPPLPLLVGVGVALIALVAVAVFVL